MKTSELTGTALDWAVAKCDGQSLGPRGFVVYYHEGEPAMWQPSTDWSQGGPIIEKAKIEVFIRDEKWLAYSSLSIPEDFNGDTPLIAAMRCYVASKLGDTINIPKELQ